VVLISVVYSSSRSMPSAVVLSCCLEHEAEACPCSALATHTVAAPPSQQEDSLNNSQHCHEDSPAMDANWHLHKPTIIFTTKPKNLSTENTESTKSKEEAIKNPTRQNCDSIFFNMSGPSPAHCQCSGLQPLRDAQQFRPTSRGNDDFICRLKINLKFIQPCVVVER